MTSRNSKKQAFKKCQNRFRGLISAYRSNKFEMDRRLPKSLVLRSGIKELYLEAQAILHPSQYDAFLNWVDGQIKTSLRDFNLSPIGYEELSGVASTIPLTPIENQLLWMAVRFNRKRNDFNKYVEIKQSVEQHALHGDYSLALNNLDDIDAIFGKSLWSVQVRIAVTQQFKGLEEQKKLTAEIRKVFRHGLLNFVAFYTSVRNEEKTSFQKYVSEVGQRLANHKNYSTAIKDFLTLILTRQWPNELDRKLGIIQVSESHSLIDSFETFIQLSENLVEECIALPDNQLGSRQILAKPLAAISGINDYRVQKLKATLGGAREDCPLDLRTNSIIENLLAGKATDAYLELSQQIDVKAQFDAWHLIYACYALFFKKRIPERFSSGVAGAAIASISRVLRGEDRVEWSGVSQKLCANFCFLPSIHGVEKFLEAILGKTASIRASLATVCVNSRFAGPEDILVNLSNRETEACFGQDSQSYLLRLWRSLVIGEMADPKSPGVQDFFFLGLWNLETGNAENSKNLLTNAQDLDELGTFDLFIFDGLITANTELGEYEAVISHTSRLVAKHPEIYSVLPKLKIFGDLTWADFKRIDPSSLYRAIGLHIAWSMFEQSKAATELRFVTGNLIRAHSVGVPSELVDVKERFHPDELIYFLKFVCTPSILDGTQIFSSSRSVMEERQAICAALRELDPGRSLEYEEEISLISSQLAHSDVQHVVDSTRIYVDTEALQRWALRELSEDIERCRCNPPIFNRLFE